MSALKMIETGKKLNNVYSELCSPILRKYGINQTSFDVLMFCANNPERNTARDICEVRGIKSGIASVAVETLIQSGLLKRERDLSDRRKYRLIPMGKAISIIEDGHAVQKHFADTLKTGVTDAEFEALNSLIQKIENNISLFGIKGN